MCLIITLVMLAFAIQNLLLLHWWVGGVQLLIALGFLVMLIRNIRHTYCQRNEKCEGGCVLPQWIVKWLGVK